MGRPKDLEPCITRLDGRMSCNGQIFDIPPKMQVFKTPKQAIKAKMYCNDLEFKFYKCLKFGECSLNR